MRFFHPPFYFQPPHGVLSFRPGLKVTSKQLQTDCLHYFPHFLVTFCHFRTDLEGPLVGERFNRALVRTRAWARFYFRPQALRTAEIRRNPGKEHFYFLRQTLVCTKTLAQKRYALSSHFSLLQFLLGFGPSGRHPTSQAQSSMRRASSLFKFCLDMTTSIALKSAVCSCPCPCPHMCSPPVPVLSSTDPCGVAYVRETHEHLQ